MAVTTVEVLERAAALVAAGWTRGSYAKDAQGKDVCERAASAVTFCVLGAVRRAAWDLMGSPITGPWMPQVFYLEKCACKALTVSLDSPAKDWEGDCADWNDAPGRTAAEVEGALRAAAAAQREVDLRG